MAEVSEDAVVVTDSASANVDYDNEKAAPHYAAEARSATTVRLIA
jgi:hypothetical protein